MNHRFRVFVLCLLLTACGEGATDGGPTPPPDGKVGMPEFLQADFGPTGNLLPGDGLMYCAPVSMADLLVWFANNGYPELGPASAAEDEVLNLVRALGGLFGTTPFNGTSGFSQEDGMRLYLGLKGFARDEYEYVLAGAPGEPMPGWDFLRRWNEGLSAVQVNPSWYERDRTPTFNNSVGGHNVALIAVDEANGTITISNPFPAGDGNPQVQPLSVVTAAESPDLQGLLKFDQDISGSDDLAIIGNAPALRLLRPSGEPARPFVLEGNTTVDTNDAVLTVLAALRGDGSLEKRGEGRLDLQSLAAEANDYGGGTVVTSGTIQARAPGLTPLGAGSLTFGPGDVILSPAGEGQDIVARLASDSGADVVYGPGAELHLERGRQARLDVEVGGRLDGTTPNLRAAQGGTLVFAPSTGGLGDVIRVKVSGSAGNLPVVQNGIVPPSILLRAADDDGSGGFVGYDADAGFVEGGYASSTDLQTAGSTAVFDARDGAAQQTIAGDVPVFALRVEAGEIRGDSESTLALGADTADAVAGLILNGGAITTGTLEVRSPRGVLYASRAGGRISSSIRGDAGLALAGPGRLVLDGSSTYSGGTRVAAGTLEVAASPDATSSTGTGQVFVQSGGTLEGDGHIGGDVVVGQDARRFGAGTIGGSVTVDEGGTFAGGGDVAGAAQVDGTLSPIGDASFLRFASDVTFSDDAVLLWSLSRLTDDGIPGVDYSYFEVEGTLDLGQGAVLMLDFAEGIAPDEDLPFWKTGHEWRIASAARIDSRANFEGLYQPPFRDGSFEWNVVSEGSREVFTLRYIPNGD